jgi:REP element-mobilizing transposase RayT
MAQSLAQLYVHTVFSTKERMPTISDDLRIELYRYTASVFNEIGCNAIEVGGTADHIHILHCLSRTRAIADVVEEIKKPTSKFMKRKGAAFGKFSWQDGYGAFSVSASMLSRVRAYIVQQQDHHSGRTYQDEFRALLKKHHIKYDERYLWT